MANVEIRYKGQLIAELDGEATATLTTAGKYVEDNIEVGSNGSSSPAADDGDLLPYGDNTLNWANVGQADYMIITDEHEDSDLVGTGAVGMMFVGEEDVGNG